MKASCNQWLPRLHHCLDLWSDLFSLPLRVDISSSLEKLHEKRHLHHLHISLLYLSTDVIARCIFLRSQSPSWQLPINGPLSQVLGQISLTLLSCQNTMRRTKVFQYLLTLKPVCLTLSSQVYIMQVINKPRTIRQTSSRTKVIRVTPRKPSR